MSIQAGYQNSPAERSLLPASPLDSPDKRRACPPPEPRRRARGGRAYLTVTVAPAPSSAALALSAASLLTRSSTGFGAPSTRSLASLRPRLVRVRTSLMTSIFFSPAASRTTSNSSFSSTSSAAPPAPLAVGAATATGAAALTSNVSSNCLTNSESSSSVISLNASSSASLVSFAIACFSLPVPYVVPVACATRKSLWSGQVHGGDLVSLPDRPR